MTEVKKTTAKTAKIAKKEKRTLNLKNSVKGKEKVEIKVSKSYFVFSIIMMAAEALIIVVLAMAFTSALSGQKTLTGGIVAATEPQDGQVMKHGGIEEGDNVYGNRNAKVVFVWYVDMQCPACASMAPIVYALAETYGDRVAFVTRNLFISGHAYAQPAGLAIEAAAKQGYYWDLVMELFERRSEWAYVNSDELFAERLGEIFESATMGQGDLSKLLNDMDSDEINKKVSMDEVKVRDDGLNATPTIIIDGKYVDFAESDEETYSLLTKRIENALAKK